MLHYLRQLLKPLFARMRGLEKRFGPKAHYSETALVFVVLASTAIISGKGWIEWLGVFGVIFTFEYQVLSTYLREHAEAKKKRGVHGKSDGFYKEIQILYYAKELIWILYFIVLGAYSAIVGTIVFILYGTWRKLYRQEFPLSDDDIL